MERMHQQLDYCQSSDLVNFERHLPNEYNKVLAQDKMLWYQKSRENWVKFENKNTISLSIFVNPLGAYFKTRDQLVLLASSSRTFLISALIFTTLFALTQVFKEVKSALISMNSYMDPFPNGFQLIFLKTFWNIVSLSS